MHQAFSFCNLYLILQPKNVRVLQLAQLYHPLFLELLLGLPPQLLLLLLEPFPDELPKANKMNGSNRMNPIIFRTVIPVEVAGFGSNAGGWRGCSGGCVGIGGCFGSSTGG